MSAAFELCGVVHLIRPVGEAVGDLEALRQALERVPDQSLFFHTAGRLLRHCAGEELPLDDLSAWVNGVVQDRETAERMSFANESSGPGPALRAAMIAVLDAIPAQTRASHDAPRGGQFVFLTSDSVRVPSGDPVSDAHELVERLRVADNSVWFYHLIEEPWFSNGPAPLTAWLREVGAGGLAEGLERTAQSGRPLESMRRQALRRWHMSSLGRRLADASLSTDLERREAGREAIARLARRLPRPSETP